MAYSSTYTGAQIDAAVGKVNSMAGYMSGKTTVNGWDVITFSNGVVLMTKRTAMTLSCTVSVGTGLYTTYGAVLDTIPTNYASVIEHISVTVEGNTNNMLFASMTAINSPANGSFAWRPVSINSFEYSSAVVTYFVVGSV